MGKSWHLVERVARAEQAEPSRERGEPVGNRVPAMVEAEAREAARLEKNRPTSTLPPIWDFPVSGDSSNSTNSLQNSGSSKANPEA